MAAFAVFGPVVLGLDDTIERRRGAKIKAKGIYRDPVRSSHSHFVKASGLRWLSLMLLAPIPWAKRVWALPFLTVLAPSERYYEKRKRAHKKLTDWARQALLQVRRWLPGRKLVVVMDAGFAAIDFLWQVAKLANPITLIARFRLDAALYAPAPQRQAREKGTTSQERQTLAYSGAGLGRYSDLLEESGHSKLVWRRKTRSRNHFRIPQFGFTVVCHLCQFAGC